MNAHHPAQLATLSLDATRTCRASLPYGRPKRRAATASSPWAAAARKRGGGNGEHPIDQMTRLVAAVAEDQDRAAFQALFEHFAPRVKAFMLRQGTDPGMAEEVVQETMVNVWRKARLFDPTKASVSTWVFTIARNLRVDLIRKANRPEPDVNDPAMVPDPEPQASEVISREQEAARLRDALATLPAEQREVLQLAFFEEMAHAQVAAKLEIPLGTVKSRIRLAFGRMRSELGARE